LLKGELDFSGYDAIVHLAGTVDYGLPKERVFELNVEMTGRVLEAAKKARVKRFVFTSTTSVYHGSYGERINESSKESPVNAYGQSKLEAEQLVRDSKIPFVILRLNTIYGPTFKAGYYEVARRVKLGKQKIIGSGNNKIALLHVYDAVRAISLALSSHRALGETIIIASEEELTQRNCYEALAEALGTEPPTKSVPSWLAYAAVRYYELKSRLLGKSQKFTTENVRTLGENRAFDASKAREFLGFQAHEKFAEGVKGAIMGWNL
jgi:UDP-glucose 4-epimerase